MGRMKEIFIGEGDRYNYSQMCLFNNPFSRGEKQKVNFYSVDEKIPIFLTLIMGLQHAFSMVGGLITVPFVIFKFSVCFSCVELQQYAIAAALITSGLCTLIQLTKVPIPGSEKYFGRQLFVGSGVLSVMGTSFTFLPIFEIAIRQMTASGIDGRTAYGKMLGTSMLCGLLELGFSVMPLKYIKRIFPPMVTAITVILIGVALIGTGMKYWGGGAVCADMVWKEHSQITGQNLTFPPPFPTCDAGDVQLGYGSRELIGLGFSVMVFLVFIELFGSVFMKNCNVIIALLFGYLIAGVTDYEGSDYVDTSKISDAKAITFLWVETFPLGLYGPAVIPLLIAYLVTTVETVGDISAVFEVSGISMDSQSFNESLQGGLTSDSICSIISGLFTSMPNTTFSQNNGVIALTKCASRRAGYGAAFWLIMMGVFSKISGIITSIPDCVIGGMTIFLFANVLVSGIALSATLDLHSRRVKFIMALSLAIGVGVTVWPFAFQDMRGSSYTANFWRCSECSDTMKGLRNGASIFLSTGYCVGTVVAMFLNAILPEDGGVVMYDETKKLSEEESNESEDGAAAPLDEYDSDKKDIEYQKNEISA